MNYTDPPSQEFLDELVERARRLGWCRDYTEIGYFIEDLHRQSGIEFKMPKAYDEN